MKVLYSYVKKNDEYLVYESIPDFHKICLSKKSSLQMAKNMISSLRKGKGFNGFTPPFFGISDR